MGRLHCSDRFHGELRREKLGYLRRRIDATYLRGPESRQVIDFREDQHERKPKKAGDDYHARQLGNTWRA